MTSINDLILGSTQDNMKRAAKELTGAYAALCEAKALLELAKERYAQACVGFGKHGASATEDEDRRYVVGDYVVHVDKHARSMGYVQGITIVPVKHINLGE